MWEFPGGKIEDGESGPDCLKRELKEEFEIEVEVGEFVGESVFAYTEKTIRLLGYKVKLISGQIKLNDHSEVKWINIEEADQYEFAPADIPLLEKLKRNDQ